MEDFKNMDEMTSKAFEEVPSVINLKFGNKFFMNFNRTPVGYMCLMNEEMLNQLQAIIDKEFSNE